MFVAAHQQQQVPCSLIMCDLDHFKLVNDTYGHQAGDEAIKSLAALLKSSCRPGDLVARYGGEEFVMLCADCDNAAAARRAEQIRKSLSQLAQTKMGGRTVTASFGVTEIQPGDTPETMLRRADRALLIAKSNGRNTIVQLGSGACDEADEIQARYPRSTRRPGPRNSWNRIWSRPCRSRWPWKSCAASWPIIEARIVSVDGSQVKLEIDERPMSRFRRLTDRPATFVIDVKLQEEHLQRDHRERGTPTDRTLTQTKIQFTISPRKNRDRRRDDVRRQAREISMSFRSYLMAYEEESPESEAD